MSAIHVAGFEAAHRGIFSGESLAVRTHALRERVWTQRLAAPPDRSFVLVAEIEGQVAGFTSGRPAREDEDDGEALGRWEDLYVSSRHKPRSLIATPLVAAARDRFRELGFADFVGFFAEDNERAGRYIQETLGMRTDGHVVVIDGARVLRFRAGLSGWPQD